MTQFNPQQQALIDAPLTTPVVGVAGAGTGKTTTILARTLRILQEFKTGRVVLVTFTRASAQDLRFKLQRQVEENDMRRVVVGTFHAVISQLIKQYATQVGLTPSFSVIDERSSVEMYKSVVERNGTFVQVLEDLCGLTEENRLNRASGKKQKTLGKKHYKALANVVSSLVNMSPPDELESGRFSVDTYTRLSKSSDLLPDCPPINPADDVEYTVSMGLITQMLREVFMTSISCARATNTINYDHILFIGYLMAKSGMLDNYRESLAHMIVDEYQDTNLLQDAFVSLLAPQNLTVVGDVDQAIYEFRGGRATLIDDRAKRSTVVNLSHNYRSLQPILDKANAGIVY